MLESFLVKIAAAVFKKAVIAAGLKSAATAYEIYSVVDAISDISDCVETTNDCYALDVSGVNVVSDYLSQAAVDRLLDVGGHSFTVEKTASGIYLASRVVPTFRVSSVSLPSGIFSGGKGSFRSGGGGGFSSGGRGNFRTGG